MGRALALQQVEAEPSLPAPDFGAWVREHEPVLRGVALRLCRDTTEAADLVQDAFERALRAQDRLRPGSNVRAWLITILNNLFLDRCRASRRTAEAPEVLERLPAAEREPEPDWAAITGEQLRAAVDQLPEPFRSIYVLRSVEGRSYLEIAQHLGIPSSTVGTRLVRARNRLRELLAVHLGPQEAA